MKPISWFFSSSKETSEGSAEDSQQEQQQQMPETVKQTPETEPSPEDQMDKIVQRLHEEKQKAVELKQTIEQLQSVIEEKDKKLKEQAEQLAQQTAEEHKLQTDTPQPQQADTPQSQPETKTTQGSDAQDAVMQQLKALSELVDARVKELIADRTELSTRLETKTTQYEELIARVQEDRYRKDKVKILRRNINLRNLVSSVLDDYRQETPKMEGADTAAATFLETQLEKIIEKMDADLRQEMLVPLVKGVEGSDFDAEHQEIVERQETDNPELDGKVFRSVAPGYIWTLPYIFKPRVNENGEEIYTYNFLLRSEDVITYKYVKKEE